MEYNYKEVGIKAIVQQQVRNVKQPSQWDVKESEKAAGNSCWCSNIRWSIGSRGCEREYKVIPLTVARRGVRVGPSRAGI